MGAGRLMQSRLLLHYWSLLFAEESVALGTGMATSHSNFQSGPCDARGSQAVGAPPAAVTVWPPAALCAPCAAPCCFG